MYNGIIAQRDRAAFFRNLIVILNVVVKSDSSDSDFEGFLEGSFDVDVVERQHNTVNSDSDISLLFAFYGILIYLHFICGMYLLIIGGKYNKN